ncbi:hypothetical protein GCM10009737_22840 [Nocardioides lentus]|uniref:histidine kinase n=1 Tax=Nocardioides lentus TaxID=338077 RepID=A0ABN2PG11_9ACTN
MLRHPVLQFLVASLLVTAVVVVGTASLSRGAAADEAISDARTLTRVLGVSVAEPAIPAGLARRDPAAVRRFERAALDRLLVPDVRRLKIWDPDGTILYSDRHELVGSRYALGPDEVEVLEQGGTDAEISDLSRPENRFERDLGGGLLEVYTRIEEPGGDPLLFEAYFSLSELDAQRETVLARFRPITLGALLVLVAVTTPLLFLLTQRLTRSAEDRERLLHSAVRASDAERVRIARDLHDGVVQDLAGSSYALSTIARRPALASDLASDLDDVSRSLRSSMRALRSLMIEIYPPDLHSAGLEAALIDLLAPVEASGVRTTLEVDDDEAASGEATALIWRVAQEAVRNAARHARPSRIDVRVAREDRHLVLVVTDDGVGFDPTAVQGASRFGLRGLASLAEEIGARLDVVSRPGRGTTVRLEVRPS